MRLRFHCQTAGSTLTAPQPLNNVTRGAVQALAAVFGGAQSLHVSGMDEALAIPSELAMKVSLRTQQIILEESGVASTIDALGGSYAVEALTDAIERDARAYLDEIDERGGTRACIEAGYFQQEIADSAYSLPAGQGGRRARGRRRERLSRGGRAAAVRPAPGRSRRSSRASSPRFASSRRGATRALVREALDAVCEAAGSDKNLMPPTIEAVRARATGGEIVEVAARRLRLLRRDRRLLMVDRHDGEPPIRVLMAKIGLDGHDRGVKVVARALRDAGMEVVYTGLHRSPAEVARTALDEDVDAIGVSVLSGAHMTIFPRLLEQLRDEGAEDVLVIAGGTILPEDATALEELGVRQGVRRRHAAAGDRRLHPGRGGRDAAERTRDRGLASEPILRLSRRAASATGRPTRRCRPRIAPRSSCAKLRGAGRLRVGALAVLPAPVGRRRRRPRDARDARRPGALPVRDEGR